MRSRLLLPALLLGLGLAALAVLPHGSAAPAPGADVGKLIKQLGSSDFEEREQASKELDALGVAALPELRKAMKSDDVEVKRRATDLVRKWERKELSDKVLGAKRVHLVYKDTPLKEAVADFGRKSGYKIMLWDPDNRLKDKTITLDTGETTFWHAFDLFCQKAGVKEPTMEDLMPRMPVMPPGGFPGAPGGFVPPPATVPGKPLPPRGKATPPADTKPAPAPATPKKETRKGTPAPTIVVATVAAAPGDAPPPPPPPAPRVHLPDGGPGARLPPAERPGVRPFRMPPMGPGQILLVAGKTRKVPTDDTHSIRIRPMKNLPFPVGGGDQIILGLQLTPEPRIRLQYVESVKVLKAIDNNDQKLTGWAPPAAPRGLGIGGGGFAGGGWAMMPGGMGMMGAPVMMGPFGMNSTMAMVRLKKGDKASKELKELKGIITAKVLSEPEAIITVTDLLKAKGKTFKGGKDGSITINEVTKGKDDQLTIRFEMQPPSDYVPDGNMPGMMPGMPGMMPPGGFVVPPVAVPPAAVPLPPPVATPPARPAAPPAPKPPVKKGAKAPAARKAVPIRIRVGGAAVARPAIAIMAGGAIGIGYGYGGFGGNGVALIDENGKTLPVPVRMTGRIVAGRFTPEYQILYRPAKGSGTPAKLVYSGRRVITVDIPFALKDVKVPEAKGPAAPAIPALPVAPPKRFP